MTVKEKDMYNSFEEWLKKGNGTPDLLVKMSKLCYQYSDALRIADYAKIYGISIPAANKETKTRKIDTLAGVRITWYIND